MKHHLFCLRHFNDVDNIAPAIYFLLKNRKIRVTVLAYSLDFAYSDDQSLNFLQQTFPDRFRVIGIAQLFGKTSNLAVRKSFGTKVLSRLRLRKSMPTFAEAVKAPEKDSPLARGVSGIFSTWGPVKRVVFDQNRTPEISGLLDALRSCGVTEVVSLPVSPWPNYNVMRQVDFINLDGEVFRQKHDYSGFDEIGQTDRHYSDSLEEFFSHIGGSNPLHGKVRILGSLRYSNEWLNIRASYMPTPHDLPDSGRRKILVIPSHPKNNSFWDEYLRTLAFISQFENFDIIVKPHTRYGHQGSGFPPNVTFTPTMDTSALIDWADVVLFWASSAALEGFQKRKTMVCLDFLNGNRSFFALHQAGIICTSRDDLIPLLTNQEWNAGILKKAEAGTKKLIDDVIYNGHEESLIDRYLAFIEGSQPLTNRQKPGNKPAATEKTT